MELAALADTYSAHNYHPLPLVVAEAEGAWVTDVGGRRYLDLVAAYSAMNFGHRHPQFLQAARASWSGSP
jgi:ornithine--oxo-acid transaminase